jgi:hypothetical protein
MINNFSGQVHHPVKRAIMAVENTSESEVSFKLGKMFFKCDVFCR